MKKRFLSILLAMVMAFSILPTASLAAGSVEEALGEIDIYNGGQEPDDQWPRPNPDLYLL